MKKLILILVVASLACTIPLKVASPNPVLPTLSAIPAPAPPSVHYDVIGTVNVRACPSTRCGVVAYLYRGDSVTARCDGNWCRVKNGYVYSPCLSEKDRKLCR